MIGNHFFTQIAAAIGSYKEVIFETNATKILVGINTIEVQELGTMSLSTPFVYEGRDKIDTRFVGHDIAFLQSAAKAQGIGAELLQIGTHLIIEAHINLSESFHVAWAPAARLSSIFPFISPRS